MARSLDRKQQRELSAFVNRLAEAAGYESTAEWARDSGYPAPNLSNLRNGKGAIDGYNLLRLITSAAARAKTNRRTLALAAAGTDGATIEDRLDSLEVLLRAALDRLGERAA